MPTTVHAPTLPKPLVALAAVAVVLVLGYDGVRIGQLHLSTDDDAHAVAAAGAADWHTSHSVQRAYATALAAAEAKGETVAPEDFSVAPDGTVTVTVAKTTTTLVLGRVERSWLHDTGTASSLFTRVKRALLGAAAALATASVVVAGPLGSGAGAAPSDDARARAATLARQVRSLQQQAEVATEAYDRVAGELASVVSGSVAARAGADAAAAVAAADRQEAGERARVLYQSGGALGLYAGLLGSGDVDVLADQLQAVRRVAASTRATGDRASTAVADAAHDADSAVQAADHQVQLQARAAQASLQVTQLLDAQTAALATADDEVRTLAAEEARAAEEAQQAAFAAQLAGAYAAAGVPLTLGTVTVPGAVEGLTGTQAAAVQAMAALAALAPPYVWGGTGPRGFDCSGLTVRPTPPPASGCRAPPPSSTCRGRTRRSPSCSPATCSSGARARAGSTTWRCTPGAA